MQNAALVRVVNRFGDGLDVARGAANPFRVPHSALRIQLRETPALDEIHDEERLPLVGADFVDGDDVRVLQAGRRRRFRTESLRQFLARLFPEQEHLHRNDAVEALLPRFEDDTHPAARDFFEQFVIAEGAERKTALTPALSTPIALTPSPSPIRWARVARRGRSGLGQRIRFRNAEREEALEAIALWRVGRDCRAAAWAGRFRCRLASHGYQSVLRRNKRMVTGKVTLSHGEELRWRFLLM